jgi:hypothetical protein
LVDIIKEAVTLLGVDGVDLVQNEGYGTSNMAANDEPSIQVIRCILFIVYFQVYRSAKNIFHIIIDL